MKDKGNSTADGSQINKMKYKITKDENQSGLLKLNNDKENQPEPGTSQLGDSPKHLYNVEEEVCPDNANSNRTDLQNEDESKCCKFVLESSLLRNSFCSKNPRHLAYIPVGDFFYTDLPERYRDSQFDELVKYLSDLVVKIKVYYISPDRPKEFAVKPNRQKSANDPLIIGSGKVIFASLASPGYRHFQGESTLIRIVTACHVVFNEAEAKSITCELFYDKEDGKCVTLRGYHVKYAKVDEDETVFVCSTDDYSLLDRLKDTIYRYKEVYESLHKKYKWVENNNLVICVSNPHGYAKQVSFGYYIKREVLDKGPRKGTSYTKYNYDLPTCASSSGAPLCIIRKENPWTHHPHKASASHGKIGISGVEWEKKSFIKKELNEK